MTSPDPALALIQEGWEHLRLQRPLAAWGSWQRALRLDPEQPAALEALDVLANAPELPVAARVSYRFRTAITDEQRARWTAAFEGRDLQDLEVAAETFHSLGLADETDAAAWFNLGLCFAWLGRNPEAIVALNNAVAAMAETDPEAASSFWMLAEVLRQGAGAEAWADDLSHSISYEWDDDWGDPLDEIAGFATLRRMPTPADPTTGKPPIENVQVAEWLDDTGAVPQVLAVVLILPGQVRLSSPSIVGLAAAAELWSDHTEDLALETDLAATPLPIRLMDAAVWRFRLPEDAPDEEHRAQIEDYFENQWVNNPARLSLGDDDNERVTPAQAARLVAQGDVILRARLIAVVNFREQLAARPGRAHLYYGYPFDRLRRRLGLLPEGSTAVDPADMSCMSEAEFASLDLATLSDSMLNEALASAKFICEGPNLTRFLEELDRRNPTAKDSQP